MAIEAQGVQIRRQSTAAAGSASSSGATIAFSTASSGLTRSAGDFVADGWGAGMKLQHDSSANGDNVFTVNAVASTVMTVWEPIVSQTTGTNITLTGNTLTAIGEVTGFNGPSGSAAVIDVTNLGSTAKEKLIGLRDEGQLSLDVLFNTDATALHTAIRIDRAARTKRVYDIRYTDSTSKPSADFFNAYVTGFSLTGGVDDSIKGSITLEITSAVISIPKV